MKICSIASGSSGNCYYLASEKTQILVDAGISTSRIRKGLESIGVKIEEIDAVFLSHEHSDHCKGLDVISRKYNIPVYASKGTFENLRFNVDNKVIISNKDIINFSDLKIEAFSKSHDANEPLSFIADSGSRRVSVITDIGFACENVKKAIQESNAIILESNHDEEMLENGRYPYFLKKRILSDEGHISNTNAARLVEEFCNDKLTILLLAHLSQDNNTETLALEAFQKLKNVHVEVCQRHNVSKVFNI